MMDRGNIGPGYFFSHLYLASLSPVFFSFFFFFLFSSQAQFSALSPTFNPLLVISLRSPIFCIRSKLQVMSSRCPKITSPASIRNGNQGSHRGGPGGFTFGRAGPG